MKTFVKPKTYTIFVFIILIAVVFVTAACRAQKQASYSSSAVVVIDNMPSDICYINNEPQIVSVNIEADDDIGLSYINIDGDLVTQLYGGGILKIGTSRMGKLVFKGNLCNEKR